MKRFSFFSCLLIAAFAVSNCAKEADVVKGELVSESGVPFEIIASTASTRTVNDGMNTKWAGDDQVSVFHAPANGAYVYDNAFSIKDVETGLFDGTLPTTLVEGDPYDWIAVYPYSEFLETVANDGEAFYYFGSRSDGSQTQSATNNTEHLAGSKLPMFGTVKAAEFTGEAPFIQMNHLAAIAAVNVTNSTSAAINVASIEFTAPVDIVGAYYIHFDSETPTYSNYNTYQSKTAKLEVTDGSLAKDATGKFYIVIKPFTATSDQTISVKVTTDAGDSQTKSFELKKDVTFSAGSIKNVKMNFTQEHQDPEYIQIFSLSDITEDGKYVFVLPDGKDPVYYAVQVAGETGNLGEVTSKITKNTEGALVFVNPDSKFVWTVGNVSGSSFNFKNGNYCIWKPSSGTKIDTKYNGSCYWTPASLESGCFSLKSDGRYMAEGTTTTVIKNYDHFIDQVAGQIDLPEQYAGAWAILKLGGSSASTDPSIEPVVVNDLPARSANYTVDVTTKNTSSALVVKSVDGTVVTNATVEGNTVTYTISNNYGTEVRSGSVVVALADDETVTGLITVNQKAPVWNVSRTEVDVKASAGSTAQLTVNSDFDWTIDASSLNGMTVAPMSFTYSGDSKQTVTITATVANGTSASVARGSFTIVRVDDAELGPVTVNQKDATLAAPVLTITPDAVNKKFTVSWATVSNASKFEYYVLDGSEYKVPVTQTTDATTTSFVVTDITLGKEYTVFVKAIGNNDPWLDSAVSSDAVTVEAGSSTKTIRLIESNWSYDATSNPKVATLTDDVVTIVYDQNESTTSISGGLTSAHTRFYQSTKVTFTPASGKTVSQLVFTATSNDYASKLKNSTWTNASATGSGSTVTVTVTNGSQPVVVNLTAQSRVTQVEVTYR